MEHPGNQLSRFVVELEYDSIPQAVISRTQDLLLDCLGSMLAGSSARPVKTIAAFARQMGPWQGGSENLVDRVSTSPMFAAMVNAAASHMVEQDDLHNGSVMHPATVVFPPALAVAQALGCSGKELLVAAVAGYEAGLRIGEFLGRSHYRIFHTTATAGTLAAAVTVGKLLRLDIKQMQHALGSAGTQAAGLWEFLRDAADSKQLHTAGAAASGLMAAWLARDGFTGASRILDGAQGMAAGMSSDADPKRLIDGLGSRWTVTETSFKWHASCRHTHPSADALLQVVQAHDLRIDDIIAVKAYVYQGALDVLGAVDEPTSVHQSKFSMGTVLGLIAKYRRASLDDFDSVLEDAQISKFRDKVSMQLDAEVDQAWPQRWIGKVEVRTADGQTLHGRVDTPKGDPQNTLDRTALESKFRRLGRYRDAATDAEIDKIIDWVWSLPDHPKVGFLVI